MAKNSKVGSRAPSVPMIKIGASIPKVIHQTYPTHSLPDELTQNVARLKDQNPGWTHVIYDNADIIKFIKAEYGAEILELFDRIRPEYGAARADVFRYLLLYARGGVYLDIKSGLERPLAEILLPQDQVVLSQWDATTKVGRENFGKHPEIKLAGGELQQWQIMTVAGHPYLRAVIKKVLHNIATYNPWIFGTGGNGVYRLTGPIAYTTAIEPILGHYVHRIGTDNALGLNYSAISSNHKKLFKSHYLMRTDPIVQQRGFARLSGWSYDMARRLKRYVIQTKVTRAT